MKNVNTTNKTLNSLKITQSTSGCFKIHELCKIEYSTEKIVKTIKLKLNSEKSEYSKLCIYNESLINSLDKICVCSDFYNCSNIVTVSSIGEVFFGSHKLLSKKDQLSEKLNFQESMIKLEIQFDFNLEEIILGDFKNNEIIKFPIPIDLEYNDQISYNISESIKAKICNLYIGIISCDLIDDEEDFICKLV